MDDFNQIGLTVLTIAALAAAIGIPYLRWSSKRLDERNHSRHPAE
jgi:hypothetical protein